MIDPRLLRDEPDLIRAAQVKRGLPESSVDRALEADAARRTAIVDFERLRAEQKQLGKLIPKAQGEEKAELLARTKTLAADVKTAEATQSDAEQDWREAIYAIPNLAADEAPAGGEDDYVVLSEHGTPRDFEAEGFTPRDHVELGRMLGAIDVERGAKVSGSRFYYLTGAGSRPRAGPGQHGDGPGQGGGVHHDDPADAGQAAGDGGHRLPRPGRRRRLPDRGPGHLSRRHLGGAAGGVPLRRDPGRRRPCLVVTSRSAPASARRQAHTARTPAGSSGCTGSTRWRCSPTRRSTRPRRSTSACSAGEGVAGQARARLPRDRRRCR